MDVGGTRGLFTTGRCALSMDWGDIGTLTPGTYAQDKTGATITPGWKEVLDRASGKLVPCDGTTCPNAVDGVNYAPFASFGGWSGAINAASPKENQDAAYDFLSYMSAPAQSGEDVTLGKTGYNPYRTSHSRTSSRGSTPASARPPPRTTSAPSSPASRTRTWSSTCGSR